MIWSLPRRTQSAKAECVVTFSEALAVFVDHQGTVIVRRLRQDESTKEKNLPSGRAKEVSTTDDL